VPNNGVFVNPAGGSWETQSNWLDETIADGVGTIATFSASIPQGNEVAVTLGSTRVIGNLVFDVP